MSGAVAIGIFQGVEDLAFIVDGEAFVGDWRSGYVSAQLFEFGALEPFATGLSVE